MPEIPSRFIDAPAIRARFGDRVGRLASFLTRSDPLADAATLELAALPYPERDRRLTEVAVQGPQAARTPALLALAESVHQAPVWFDRARAERGGAAFLGTGLPGGLVLAFRSLILGYCSPAGNKPLAYSGRLERDVPRRLVETSRFVHDGCRQDNLRAGQPGFVAALKVRMMHAQVRQLLLASGRWREEWGAPVNQYDMAGTIQLFSSVVLGGLDRIGIAFSLDEREAFLHLWRYVGWLMGVEEELLATSAQEADDLWTMISRTQAPPDADSKALAKALLESRPAQDPAAGRRSQRMRSFAYELSRYLVGDEAADLLDYPRSAWVVAPPVVSLVIGQADALRRALPFGDRLTFELGLRYWEGVVRLEAGSAVDFALPRALRGRERGRAVA